LGRFVCGSPYNATQTRPAPRARGRKRGPRARAGDGGHEKWPKPNSELVSRWLRNRDHSWKYLGGDTCTASSGAPGKNGLN